ncbi:MAG: hypothetical protein QG636_347 [Patescibacteria group bacterium]|nr:hypothetical protein [Patescibacteria group bacterium]
MICAFHVELVYAGPGRYVEDTPRRRSAITRHTLLAPDEVNKELAKNIATLKGWRISRELCPTPSGLYR